MRPLQRIIELVSMAATIWWIVGGGEFSTWLEGKEMPFAAAKELEELRDLYKKLMEMVT